MLLDIFSPEITNEFQNSEPFLNTAYFGPSPKSAGLLAQEALQKEMNPKGQAYDLWRNKADECRKLFAKLTHEHNFNNIGFHTSVSGCISQIAFGFPLSKEDNIIVMDGDYPSNILPWMESQQTKNFSINKCSLETFFDLNLLESQINKNTKVINISHVMFNTGLRLPIKEIGKLCAQNNILFIIDATQSLGGIELTKEEIEHADVLVAAGYKWLLGPYGCAMAKYSLRAINEIKRKNVSWLSSVNAKSVGNLLNYSLETLEGAKKFDRGQAPAFMTTSLLEGSLRFLTQFKSVDIENYNRNLCRYFIQNCPKEFSLAPTQSNSLSDFSFKKIPGHILCLKSSFSSSELETELIANNVEVSVREGNLRISFHLFNTKKHVEKLCESLTTIVNKKLKKKSKFHENRIEYIQQ